MALYALIAGEASGDALGAGLVREIAARDPEARIVGVAGPRMIEAGCEPLERSEELAVMGLAEVLVHLPRLVRLRRNLVSRLRAMRPDCVVGIDSPEFNLGLEAELKRAGIPTVHYVSPSIWAWRPRRINKLKRACHRVLCLLPFEPRLYRRAGVDAVFVGHPLADAIPDVPDGAAARRILGLSGDRPVVALLPGSRHGEVSRLAAPMAGAARLIRARRPDAVFVAPMAAPELKASFHRALAAEGMDPGVHLLDNGAHLSLTAADVALVASGTATLEAMMLKCPMVVAYRVAPLTHFILRRLGLLRIRRYALPNILAGRPLVPELMQGEATAESLAAAALAWLEEPERASAYRAECRRLHRQMRRDANARAAEAVLSMAREPGLRHAG